MSRKTPLGDPYGSRGRNQGETASRVPFIDWLDEKKQGDGETPEQKSDAPKEGEASGEKKKEGGYGDIDKLVFVDPELVRQLVTGEVRAEIVGAETSVVAAVTQIFLMSSTSKDLLDKLRRGAGMGEPDSVKSLGKVDPDLLGRAERERKKAAQEKGRRTSDGVDLEDACVFVDPALASLVNAVTLSNLTIANGSVLVNFNGGEIGETGLGLVGAQSAELTLAVAYNLYMQFAQEFTRASRSQVISQYDQAVKNQHRLEADFERLVSVNAPLTAAGVVVGAAAVAVVLAATPFDEIAAGFAGLSEAAATGGLVLATVPVLAEEQGAQVNSPEQIAQNNIQAAKSLNQTEEFGIEVVRDAMGAAIADFASRSKNLIILKKDLPLELEQDLLEEKGRTQKVVGLIGQRYLDSVSDWNPMKHVYRPASGVLKAKADAALLDIQQSGLGAIQGIIASEGFASR